MSELNLKSLKGKKREQNDFNDWREYMRVKVRKLDKQFQVLNDSNDDGSNALKNLFKDIVIFVNGYTEPSLDELKRLMKKHGGGFQHYYSKSNCTHIVATNLPDSKIKKLKDEKVVHPDWIVESVKTGKLLPYRNYLLYGGLKKYTANKNLKNAINASTTILNASCRDSPGKNEDENRLATETNIGSNSTSTSVSSSNAYSTVSENYKGSSVQHSDRLRCIDDQSDSSTSNEITNSGNCENEELLEDDTLGSSEFIEKCTSNDWLIFSEEDEMPGENEIVDNGIEFTKANASESLGKDIAFGTSNEILKLNQENEKSVVGIAIKMHEKESKAANTNPKIISAGEGGVSMSHSTHQTLPQRCKSKSKSIPKAGDENFMHEFYSHSRLHYLSTWGAEFRDFINNLIRTTELKKPKRSPQKIAFKKRVIMHIDMDSFFVSVALRCRPELRGKPVAVCHAGRGGDTSKTDLSFGSTSEIASCSYEARSLGVKNGMWLGQARQLCPNLVCVPYQFEEYRQVSQQLYEILASYTHEIQAVSCDEAFVDLASYIETENLTALEVAQIIREEIKKKTNCPASAGIASNILLARMSTKVAKPNGQFHLQDDETLEFIGKQKVADLPGVGYALNQKLKSLNVVTCAELRRISMPVLRREFGQKTGEMLYKYSRGQDDRELKIERERKSVSAEINYAIRFTEDSEPEKFIYDLSNEVHRRLKTAGVKGKQVTLKLRVRQKDAPINPSKFMGCGRCDNMSRSTNMKTFTDDPSLIAKECISMLKQLSLPASDIRGMGIQMSKLSDDSRKISSSKTLHRFMKPVKTNEAVKDSSEILAKEDSRIETGGNLDCKAFEVAEASNEREQKQNLEGESPKVAQFHVGDNLDEFKLVLSDEEDEAFCDPQDISKTRSLSDASCSKEQPQTCDTTSSSGQNFPPLPTFPIFSPKRTSPSKRKTSPNFGAKKRTPRKSPSKSPKKSPGKLSSQRSLYSLFKSTKETDATEMLVLPSPSQIDPTVFDALPDEVKKDIEISYRNRNLRIAKNTAGKLPSTTSRALEERKDFPPPASNYSKPDQERNETNTKKSKVKHKSIKSFAAKKTTNDDDTVELDASVLNALPESIRREVRLAYEQQKRHDEKEKEKQLNVNINTSISWPSEPAENEIKRGSLTVPTVKLAGAESCGEVREMLKLWINDTDVPLDEDINVLVEYLSNLIIHKDMEKMWLVLKFYRRLVVDKETWHPFFNKVLDNVQDILNKNYGGKLSMKHFVIL